MTSPEQHIAPAQPILHTPADAAAILAIKESWLRRRAGQRAIPSTMLGKHLRFSDTDLTEIAERGRRPAREPRPRTPRRRPPDRLHASPRPPDTGV